ncbi:hypothetical protein D8674_022606 [Pyrus ussuriensis x Pyrus communis]|uniref:Receptor-like protein 2 n=1 Tax=Pyrus ussuriensis x Pyrus communis TaxID=2448454 RepID=A0A5N5GKY6_9ROSA|nr:hypothetical protein D8674_022606 [Pyrus ussuriensis x Pyrus communis]
MAHGFLLILLISSIISTNTHACHQFERSPLLSFALTLSSFSLKWTSINCCRWKGITCNHDGWVTELLLPSKGLNDGMFLSSFGNLTHLIYLNLSHNSLYGSLETKVFLSLNRLEILDLSYNLLSGELPFSLLSSRIRTVNLGCSKLQILRAGNNNLSGLLPKDIYNATNLKKLHSLPIHSIDGVLPHHFGKLFKLKLITLDLNYLEGSLPPSLMNCTNLTELHILSNNLEGDVSTFDFSRLSDLTNFDLRANNFTGTLPRSLYSCTSLEVLGLSRNHLEGQIQPDIVSLKSLSFLSLSYNRLTNVTGSMRIMIGCKNLRTLVFARSFKVKAIPYDRTWRILMDFKIFGT